MSKKQFRVGDEVIWFLIGVMFGAVMLVLLRMASQ